MLLYPLMLFMMMPLWPWAYAYGRTPLVSAERAASWGSKAHQYLLRPILATLSLSVSLSLSVFLSDPLSLRCIYFSEQIWLGGCESVG